MKAQALSCRNGEAVAWKDVPVLAVEDFRQFIIDSVNNAKRLLALTGIHKEADGVKVLAVLADDGAGSLEIVASNITGAYPAITPECPQAHYFERELREQWSLQPRHHPWLKPVRFPAGEQQASIGKTDYLDIESEETHIVSVGPIHAGIIEPGHFHFCCHGEQILHLELSLGYQHRGIERALIGGPDRRTIHYMETLAGDTSVGHTLAYCHALEALASVPCTPQLAYCRAIALELERLANHVGNLGSMSGDVGFLPTASLCGGLRGDYLNLTAMLCGSRLGRGLIRPAEMNFAVDTNTLRELRLRLGTLLQSTKRAVDLLWSSASVRARFKKVGMVTNEQAHLLGMVGPVARASGVALDVRCDHPLEAWRDETFTVIQVEKDERGDVFARARQRSLEIEQSHQLLNRWLDRALAQKTGTTSFGSDAYGDMQPQQGGALSGALPDLATDQLVISLVEGWRGEICHIALTDGAGHFQRYKIIDPSFHNWFGLTVAMRDQPILDFPVCNKSFDLSYCGHDL